MRWKLGKKAPSPIRGDVRIVKKFLYLPKAIGDDFRWLEKATWCEMFKLKSHYDRNFYLHEQLDWVPLHWLDSESSIEAIKAMETYKEDR